MVKPNERVIGHSTDTSTAELFQKMMEENGPTMVFRIQRHGPSWDPAKGPLTFSEEAMSETMDAMTLWVGSRIMRYMNDTGKAPVVASVEVTVTIDKDGGTVQ